MSSRHLVSIDHVDGLRVAPPGEELDDVLSYPGFRVSVTWYELRQSER